MKKLILFILIFMFYNYVRTILSKTICIFFPGFSSNGQKMKTFVLFAVIAGCTLLVKSAVKSQFPYYTSDEEKAFEKFKVRLFILQRYEDLEM